MWETLQTQILRNNVTVLARTHYPCVCSDVQTTQKRSLILGEKWKLSALQSRSPRRTFICEPEPSPQGKRQPRGVFGDAFAEAASVSDSYRDLVRRTPWTSNFFAPCSIMIFIACDIICVGAMKLPFPPSGVTMLSGSRLMIWKQL
jgi:hypothetical protein